MIYSSYVLILNKNFWIMDLSTHRFYLGSYIAYCKLISLMIVYISLCEPPQVELISLVRTTLLPF